MKTYNIDGMTRGWFVGEFNPTAFRTEGCEAAYKVYKAGDEEPKHYHKIATEVTLIAQGEVEMNGKVFVAGDIIVVLPNEEVKFKAITDAVNVVIKIPGANDDKYLSEEE